MIGHQYKCNWFEQKQKNVAKATLAHASTRKRLSLQRRKPPPWWRQPAETLIECPYMLGQPIQMYWLNRNTWGLPIQRQHLRVLHIQTNESEQRRKTPRQSSPGQCGLGSLRLRGISDALICLRVCSGLSPEWHLGRGGSRAHSFGNALRNHVW